MRATWTGKRLPLGPGSAPPPNSSGHIPASFYNSPLLARCAALRTSPGPRPAWEKSRPLPRVPHGSAQSTPFSLGPERPEASSLLLWDVPEQIWVGSLEKVLVSRKRNLPDQASCGPFDMWAGDVGEYKRCL